LSGRRDGRASSLTRPEASKPEHGEPGRSLADELRLTIARFEKERGGLTDDELNEELGRLRRRADLGPFRRAAALYVLLLVGFATLGMGAVLLTRVQSPVALTFGVLVLVALGGAAIARFAQRSGKGG